MNTNTDQLLADLIAAARPICDSLLARIDADNAMSLQAVMVRRLAQVLAQVEG